MANQEGKYNIKVVSKMLGIQSGTLRAWERRYKMIAPIRNDAGHRVYTEEHISILKWLISKMTQGFTISQAVSLLEKHQFNPEKLDISEGDYFTNLSDDLLKAFILFDEPKAQELINLCFSLYTIDKVTIEILGTLMSRIGKMREQGEITSAHEHFATAILRSRIGMIVHTLPQDGIFPKAMAICGPGESHEIGLLIFTLFLRQRGLDVIYLGPSIDKEDLEEAILFIKPKLLFLSCTMKENVTATLSFAEQVASQNKMISVGLYGNAIDTLNQLDKNQFHSMIVGLSHKEWGNWLKSRIS